MRGNQVLIAEGAEPKAGTHDGITMMTQYIIGIIAIIIAVVLIKRFVGCLVRSAVTIALVAVLAYLYFHYLA